MAAKQNKEGRHPAAQRQEPDENNKDACCGGSNLNLGLSGNKPFALRGISSLVGRIVVQFMFLYFKPAAWINTLQDIPHAGKNCASPHKYVYYIRHS